MSTIAACRNSLADVPRVEMLALAKSCLLSHFGESDAGAGSNSLVGQAPLERVNVTLRTRGRLRGSMSAAGENLGAQIQGAVIRAACDKRFKSRLAQAELDHVDLEIWLQTGSERISAENAAAGGFLELGVDGAEVRLGSKSAYYKPSVAITRGRYTTEAFMSSLCKKAGLAKETWKDPRCIVLRTRWISVSDGPGGSVSPHIPGEVEIRRADVARWLQESAAYLTNSIQASGDFTYIYDPINDREIIEPPSSVRLAGCLFALSRFYDSAYADSANIGFENAIHRVAATQVERTIEWVDARRIMPEPKPNAAPKLGSTALLALALGCERLSQEFRSYYESLVGSVISAQTPSGRFLTHFGVSVENAQSSEFFAGQALLTLVQRAERGDGFAADKCGAAFAPYRKQFETRPSSAFAGWHVDVWSRMALLTGREDYAAFAFEQADWLLKMQITSGPAGSSLGGFSSGGRMPKFSSVVYLEAIVRAYILARAVAPDRIGHYRRAIELGLGFCSRLRLSGQQMAWFPNPKRSSGGVGLSVLDRRVRCDVPQHFITLCLALLEADGLLSVAPEGAAMAVSPC